MHDVCMARQAASLGARIRNARQRKGIKRPEFAKALGVSLKTIDNWENDRTHPRDKLGLIEAFLGVNLTADEVPEERDPIAELVGERGAEEFRRAARKKVSNPERLLEQVEELLAREMEPALGDDAQRGPRAEPAP